MNDEWETIVPFGDLHLGYSTCNIDKIQKVVDYIKNKNCKWAGMGDFIDNTPPGHRYYRHETTIVPPQEQVFQFVELVKPISEQCIGLIYGNHEIRSLDYKTGYDPIKQMEYLLDLPPRYRQIGTQTYFHISKYDIFAMHGKARGYFFSSKISSKMNAIMKMRNTADADIYLMGHVHDTINFSKQIIIGKKEFKTIHFVMTGSFVEYFDSYGEDLNYNMVETGCNAVHLNKLQKEVKVERIV